MRRQFRLAAELDAARLGAGAAFAGAGADQIALELRQAAEHGQHKAAVRRRGVGPCVAERTESGLLAGDRRERVEKIAGRARQPVEPRHHQHVAGAERVERPAKLRPVGLGSARHFAEHFFGSGGGQRCNLRLDALAVRRYPCIAVDHAHILHVYSAQVKGSDFRGLGFVQKS